MCYVDYGTFGTNFQKSIMFNSTTTNNMSTTSGVQPIGTTVLLSSAYFPPVQWMQKLHRYNKVYVERNDNFCKQTYRNRCVIATAITRHSVICHLYAIMLPSVTFGIMAVRCTGR